MQTHNVDALFSRVTENLDIFIQEATAKNSLRMATDMWSVKEVLCHIVYWHEKYAANYNALAHKQEPPIPEGPLYKLNLEGVDSLKKFSQEELIKRLHKAHALLFESIVEKKVPQMTYKKGGRVYETTDFLDMVARHINTHTKQIKRAK